MQPGAQPVNLVFVGFRRRLFDDVHVSNATSVRLIACTDGRREFINRQSKYGPMSTIICIELTQDPIVHI